MLHPHPLRMGAMNIDLTELIAGLALPFIPPDWPSRWKAFRHTDPDPAFSIAEEAIEDTLAFCQYSYDVAQAIRETADRVRRDPGLIAMTRFLFDLFFAEPPPDPVSLATWPFVTSALPTLAALLPALMLVAGVPKVRQAHTARNIPETITRATLSDLEVWMRTFRREHGHWGLMNLNWLSNHWHGKLYRLGRLQFMQGRFPSMVRVFQETATNRVLALAEPGTIRYRQDGLVDGTQDVFDPSAWTPTLTRTSDTITGHPVDPAGYVQKRSITLPTRAWRQVLAPGDPMLDIHIPEGGAMDFQACGQSLQQAPPFFSRHFSENPAPLTFYCATWFFDSQLQAILSPQTNIIRFQREFYLYPIRSTEDETFRRVFGSKPTNLHTAPRDTSLRRAILDFTLSGHHLRCAAGFRLLTAPPWGSAPYQQAAPPLG